jgi:arsenate reductase
MSDNVIYHNARCSKSRAALELLRERDLDVKVVEYLKTPPSRSELAAICKKLGKRPIEICRTKEKLFSRLGLAVEDERPDAEWLRILSDNPALIERPIVIFQGRAAIGRPLEDVVAILE